MMGKAAAPALVVAMSVLLASPALAEIVVFDGSSLERNFAKFRAIDFEDIRLGDRGLPGPGSGAPTPVTTVRIQGVTFSDPYGLSTGFCSSPTCTPDPRNPDGGNNELFLDPGGEISFASAPRLVVLDVQGIGDNPFELQVTDGSGHALTVDSHGVLFGRTLLGLRSDNGVQRIAVLDVGGTLGPIALARVLFTHSQMSAAGRTSDGVRIVWELADGMTLSEAWLERSEGVDGERWIRPRTERSIDNSTVAEIDRSAVANRVYRYRLVAVEGGNGVVMDGPIVVDSQPALESKLVEVGPNPAKGRVTVLFALQHEGTIDIDMLDVQGRSVASLARGMWPAGTHAVEWNGSMRNGAPAPPGIYLLRYARPGGLDWRMVVRLP